MNPNLFAKVIFKLLTILRMSEAKWKLKRRFPVLFFQPHMERKEYFLFKKVCKKKNVFLEYGSGGSTIYLLKQNKIVFSVESNLDFFRYMNSIDMVNKSIGSNLKYEFVDLGPTNQWGKPLLTDTNNGWEDYYKRIWKEIHPVKNKVDVIFIDGRFRVSCCFYSIIKVMEYGWKDTVFIIHDFWRRKKYHVVLDFLEEITSSSNLAVFKLKDDIDIELLKAKMEEYTLATA